MTDQTAEPVTQQQERVTKHEGLSNQAKNNS